MNGECPSLPLNTGCLLYTGLPVHKPQQVNWGHKQGQIEMKSESNNDSKKNYISFVLPLEADTYYS